LSMPVKPTSRARYVSAVANATGLNFAMALLLFLSLFATGGYAEYCPGAPPCDPDSDMFAYQMSLDNFTDADIVMCLTVGCNPELPIPPRECEWFHRCFWMQHYADPKFAFCNIYSSIDDFYYKYSTADVDSGMRNAYFIKYPVLLVQVIREVLLPYEPLSEEVVLVIMLAYDYVMALFLVTVLCARFVVLLIRNIPFWGKQEFDHYTTFRNCVLQIMVLTYSFMLNFFMRPTLFVSVFGIVAFGVWRYVRPVKESFLQTSKPTNFNRVSACTVATGYEADKTNGLGWCFTRGYAFVSRHQLDDLVHSEARIFSIVNGQVVSVPLSIYKIYEGLDLAIVRVDKNTKTGKIAGYKKGLSVQVFCAENGKTSVFKERLQATSPGTINGTWKSGFYYSSSTAPGCSGGPVLFGNSCVGVHIEGSQRFNTALSFSDQLLSEATSLPKPEGMEGETVDFQAEDVMGYFHNFVGEGNYRFARAENGDHIVEAKVYDKVNNVTNYIQWNDGDVTIVDEKGNETSMSGLGAAVNYLNVEPANKSFRKRSNNKKKARGKAQAARKRAADSGYKVRKGRTDLRKTANNIVKNRRYKHSIPLRRKEAFGDLAFPDVGAHDEWTADGREADFTPPKLFSDLQNWTCVGSTSARFFPLSTLTFNQECEGIKLALGERFDDYIQADCTKAKTVKVFKQEYDNIKDSPVDFSLWRDLFVREVPVMMACNPNKSKILTLDQAWDRVMSSGIEKKSCGFPYNTDAPCGGKHQSKMDVRNCEKCWSVVSECFECVLRGGDPEKDLEVLCTVADVFPKDELQKKKKYMQGRTRLICGANLVLLLVQLAVAPNNGVFKEDPYLGPSRIGMTGPKGGFQRLRRKLMHCLMFSESDYNGFDYTQHEDGLKVVMEILKVVFGVDTTDERTKNAWEWVAATLSGPKLFRIFDTIVMANKGGINSSGQLWTGEVNTIYNIMVTIYASFKTVPTIQEFWLWKSTHGAYLNKYGDDTLDGAVTRSISTEEYVARCNQFGVSLRLEDVKISNTIVGLSFLGYEFTDCEFGVKFVRMPKAMTRFCYKHFASEDEKFMYVQCMKIIMAGNEEGLKLLFDYEAQAGYTRPNTLSRQHLVNFWTGRESLGEDHVTQFLHSEKSVKVFDELGATTAGLLHCLSGGGPTATDDESGGTGDKECFGLSAFDEEEVAEEKSIELSPDQATAEEILLARDESDGEPSLDDYPLPDFTYEELLHSESCEIKQEQDVWPALHEPYVEHNESNAISDGAPFQRTVSTSSFKPFEIFSSTLDDDIDWFAEGPKRAVPTQRESVEVTPEASGPPNFGPTHKAEVKQKSPLKDAIQQDYWKPETYCTTAPKVEVATVYWRPKAPSDSWEEYKRKRNHAKRQRQKARREEEKTKAKGKAL